MSNQNGNQKEKEFVLIPKEGFNAITNYLLTQPCKDVLNFIRMFENQTRIVKENDIKENDIKE